MIPTDEPGVYSTVKVMIAPLGDTMTVSTATLLVVAPAEFVATTV